MSTGPLGATLLEEAVTVPVGTVLAGVAELDPSPSSSVSSVSVRVRGGRIDGAPSRYPKGSLAKSVP